MASVPDIMHTPDISFAIIDKLAAIFSFWDKVCVFHHKRQWEIMAPASRSRFQLVCCKHKLYICDIICKFEGSSDSACLAFGTSNCFASSISNNRRSSSKLQGRFLVERQKGLTSTHFHTLLNPFASKRTGFSAALLFKAANGVMG